MKAILSQRLRQAAEQHRAGGEGADLKLSLQDLLRLHGESSLGTLSLNERWSGRCLHGLAWMYESSQRFMRPRWTWLSHAGTRAWWGAWIALMGLVIFVPLPLGNVLPGLSLVLLSLGWMFRDGLALLLSTLTGLAGVVYGVSMGHLAVQAFDRMMDLLPK